MHISSMDYLDHKYICTHIIISFSHVFLWHNLLVFRITFFVFMSNLQNSPAWNIQNEFLLIEVCRYEALVIILLPFDEFIDKSLLGLKSSTNASLNRPISILFSDSARGSILLRSLNWKYKCKHVLRFDKHSIRLLLYKNW